MDNCVFCQILLKRLPGSFVYEDEACAAFMDINPINEGHVLVIPKIHRARFSQLDGQAAGHLFSVARKILSAIETSDLRCEGANLFLSDGEIAGQEVMHSHLHILPRFKGDGQRVGFSHSDPDKVSRTMLDSIAEKIRTHL